MPIPVLLAGAAAATIAAVLYRLRNRVENKRVLILGPRGAGKSRLHRLLTRGERSLRDLGAGGETFDFVAKKVRMRDLRWHIDYVDSPSSPEEIAVFAWKEHLADLDLVVFVVDGPRLAEEDYRATAELLAVTGRLNAAEQTRWMLVISHSDQLGEVSTAADVPGSEELARVLGDHHPQLADLQDWASASHVVRRVVASLR